MTKKKQTYEEALAALEAIVSALETGELALEDALKRFEEGIRLSKYCAKTLDETEKRITVLLEDETGGAHESPFPSTAE